MDTLSLTARSFDSGTLVMTSLVFDAITEHTPFRDFILSSIDRHMSCDWGDTCAEDAGLNDSALQDGGRIFSVYSILPSLFSLETRIWIITDADRSYTTVLFPSDY